MSSPAYDPLLVALSVAIAVAAACTSLDLASRAAPPGMRPSRGQLWVCACALGLGLWSMHFVGMAAYRPGLTVVYDLLTTLASLGCAIAGAAVALATTGGPTMSARHWALGSLAMSGTLGAMHFIGMGAMRMQAVLTYEAGWVAAAGALSLAAAGLTLRLARDARTLGLAGGGLRRLGGGVLLGLLVAAMHYAGMAAARLTPTFCAPPTWPTVDVTYLGVAAIIGVTVLVLTGSLVGAMTAQMAALMASQEAIEREVARRTAELREREAELRAANERLLVADRHKDEFLGVLSHELRTPLNFIMGFASYLDDDSAGALSPEQRACVGRILAGADRMLALVDDLLEIAMIRSGRLELDREPTDVRALVEQAVAREAPLAAEKGISLTTAFSGDTQAFVDGRRLSRVLGHLLANARKFMAEGEILVECRLEGGRVAIAVHDRGPGVPASQLARLFRPFEQLDMSLTRQAGGAGLGLAICRALVEAHGGAIAAHPRPGGGATFEFWLPSAPAPVDAAPPFTAPTVLSAPASDPAEALRLTLDHLTCAVAYIDRELRFRVVNAQFAKRVGMPAEAMLGRTLPAVMPEAYAQGAEALERVLSGGEPYRSLGQVFRAAMPSGEVVEIVRDVSTEPVRDAEGRVVGAVVMSVDASDRVRVERELAARTAMLDRIVHHAPAGMLFVDRDLIVRWANPAHLARVGRTAEEFVGRRVGAAFPGAEEQVEAPLREVMATRRIRRREGAPLVIRGEAGERQTYWDSECLPIEDDAGGIAGVLVFALDVTERVERIRALEEAEAHKNQFLSILSHELRTPIAAIMGFGSLLADEAVAPVSDAQRLPLARILESADALLALVDDLLDMGRIQAGKLVLERHPTDPALLFEATVASLAPLAAARRIDLALHVEGRPPAIALDAQRIRQVVTNLVGNAIKFSVPGGRVDVRLAATAETLVGEVADDGPGIPGDRLERIFDAFYQVDMSATRPERGLGLGLSIARAIVLAHGGTLDVESAPGRGATFRFSLPLHASPGPAPASGEDRSVGREA